jgi:NAD(P)-dependent dehydrogenase (short-subunit alcohol dehydrogenase family)
MSQKQVVVTGASRGIGRSIAELFLAKEWKVWSLSRQANSIEGLKGDVEFVPFDAESEISVLAAAEQLQKRARVDVLVNNAGIALAAPLTKTSSADFLKIQAVNVVAPFLLCRELIPTMAKNGGGRVVNIASTAAKKGFKYTSAYCASKHALLGLSRALAAEFGHKNITVNTVCPGWVETDMFKATTEKVAATTGRSEGEARQVLEKMNLLNRIIRPTEVAELVYFLSDSAAGASCTGADFGIDAGEAA